MRIKVFPLLNKYALASYRSGITISHAYREIDESDIEFLSVKEALAETEIRFVGHHVLKSYRLPFADRLFGCRLDKDHGLMGGWGELINTLVANTLDVPAPQLAWSSLNLLTGRLTIATERLQNCVTLVDELVNAADTHTLMHGAFSLLAKALGAGIYHVDPNASNIMLSSNRDNWYLIDFEQAVPLGTRPEIAFALQAASLFDWRIQPKIQLQDYREWVIDYLKGSFGIVDVAASLSLLDEYTRTRPNRLARRRRLQMACGGQSDIRGLLSRSAAIAAA